MNSSFIFTHRSRYVSLVTLLQTVDCSDPHSDRQWSAPGVSTYQLMNNIQIFLVSCNSLCGCRRWVYTRLIQADQMWWQVCVYYHRVATPPRPTGADTCHWSSCSSLLTMYWLQSGRRLSGVCFFVGIEPEIWNVCYVLMLNNIIYKCMI